MTKPKLLSLEFLRVYACILVYRGHIARPNIDDFALEIFFVLSGFVIAYRYFDRCEPLSLKGTAKFLYRRISRLYPIHLLMVAAVILLQGWYQYQGQPDLGFGSAGEFIKKLLLSLTLTQSWAADIQYHFCMNGVVWFLSALVFFYLLTPLLLTFFRKLPHKSLLAAVILACSVIYVKVPGWMGSRFFSTCPLLHLPLYTEGLALGSLYVVLLQNRTFAEAKKVRSVGALILVGYYVFQVYGAPQLGLAWPLPFGKVDIPILLLVFGLAQDIGPIRLLGNPAVQFLAARNMEFFLCHQVWLLYVDALREYLATRQIWQMSSDAREIVRLVGLFLLVEILHSVVPKILKAMQKSIRKNSANEHLST